MRYHKQAARIVSLCPSVTQTINDLEADNMLIGITDFCPEPESDNNSIVRIGGPKNPNLKLISEIKPNIIIFIEEENIKDDFIELSKEFNCISFKVETIRSSLDLTSELGFICKKEKEAERIIQLTEKEIRGIQKEDSSYYYFVWKKPWIVAGRNTYISSFLSLFGQQNKTLNTLYPRVELNDLDKFPNKVFLPDEPYNFNKNNTPELRNYFTESNFVFLDGRICSWFGSHMLKSIRDFKQTLKVS